MVIANSQNTQIQNINIEQKGGIALNKLIGSFFVSFLLLSQNYLSISQYLFDTTLPFKILLVLGCLCSLFYFKMNFSLKRFLFFLTVGVFFVLTSFLHNNSSLTNYLMYFVLYGLCAFGYSFCKIDEDCLFKICVTIGIIWLILFFGINSFQINDSFTFGYNILPITISSFLLALRTDKSKKVQLIIRIIFLAVFLILLLFSGSRGPVLAFFIFIFIYFMPCLLESKKRIYYIVFFALFLLIVFNFKNIVVFLYNLAPGKFAFIDKTYRLLLSESGVTNGRLEIILKVLRDYNPINFIFGIGIGGFNSAYPDDGYTHNIFLSMTLDFGILGLIFILSVVAIFTIYRIKTKKNSSYLTLLFTVSIVKLCFSGDYWKHFTFWLLVFFILSVDVVDLIKSKANNKLLSVTARAVRI